MQWRIGKGEGEAMPNIDGFIVSGIDRFEFVRDVNAALARGNSNRRLVNIWAFSTQKELSEFESGHRNGVKTVPEWQYFAYIEGEEGEN